MLTTQQEAAAKAAFSTATEVYCSGAVQLYSSSSNSWDYTGVCGVASLLIQSDIYYIKIYHLDVRCLFS